MAEIQHEFHINVECSVPRKGFKSFGSSMELQIHLSFHQFTFGRSHENK